MSPRELIHFALRLVVHTEFSSSTGQVGSLVCVCRTVASLVIQRNESIMSGLLSCLSKHGWNRMNQYMCTWFLNIINYFSMQLRGRFFIVNQYCALIFPGPRCYRSSGLWSVLCSGYTQYSDWVIRVMASTVFQVLKRFYEAQQHMQKSYKKKVFFFYYSLWRKINSPTLRVRR